MRALKWLGILVLSGIAVIAVAMAAAHEPKPKGTSGPEAEAAADRIEAFANAEAWARTRVMAWTFRGAHHHLWDRDRDLIRVKRGKETTWLRLAEGSGIAEEDGVRLGPPRLRRALDSAYARWANDSFWLNPLVKLRDPGTTREWVPGPSGGLLVSYASGGVTPGDAYLWELDEKGRPTAWRMWVSILPVGGVRTTWEGWVTLATGARVATTHGAAVGTLRLTNIRGGATWRDLGFETDPFAPLQNE